MKTAFTGNRFPLLVAFFLLAHLIILQGCKKTQPIEETGNEEIAGKKKNPPPPPPPPPFYFYCGTPVIDGTIAAGVPTNATTTLTYANSPGGSYPAFTSAMVNGITLTAPAGTLNTGSGSILFTFSGTPTNPGFLNIAVSINGSVSCPLLVTVTNAPASGPTVDPSSTIGSTGVVNFIYKGQAVAYKTVRAKDGRIWLQQNLGSPQVAFHEVDHDSYGDYFQWGRWDDGHQARNSATVTGGPSLMNPSHIPWGNSNFIKGAIGTKWWSVGGVASDTWSGTTATATNGKDPCAALGAGWRLPTAAEWDNISLREDLFGTIGAFQSNLKLTPSGYRYSSDGSVYSYNGEFGYYWTSNATDNSNAKVFFFDNLYNAGVTTANRAEGFSCRCIKN